MHYYQFNIGDYRRQTSHLTLVEHGIYRALLDTYYLEEGPLCSDHAKLMRSHCIRTSDEQEALKNVLDDFFELTENGYEHAKCEKVLAKIREKSEKARAAAEKRWGSDAKRMRTHSECNATQLPNYPIPNTQESKSNNNGDKSPATRKRFIPPSRDEVSQYCKERRNAVDPGRFVDYYTSNDWRVGRNKMKDWKAAVRTWEGNGGGGRGTSRASAPQSFGHIDYGEAGEIPEC